MGPGRPLPTMRRRALPATAAPLLLLLLSMASRSAQAGPPDPSIGDLPQLGSTWPYADAQVHACGWSLPANLDPGNASSWMFLECSMPNNAGPFPWSKCCSSFTCAPSDGGVVNATYVGHGARPVVHRVCDCECATSQDGESAVAVLALEGWRRLTRL